MFYLLVLFNMTLKYNILTLNRHVKDLKAVLHKTRHLSRKEKRLLIKVTMMRY
jgi:hypothetical protein